MGAEQPKPLQTNRKKLRGVHIFCVALMGTGAAKTVAIKYEKHPPHIDNLWMLLEALFKGLLEKLASRRGVEPLLPR